MLAKIVSLLSRQQKKQAVILLVLVFIGMLLEMLGVGLIFPILALMIEPDLAMKYPFLKPAFEYLGMPTQIQLIAWSMLSLAVFYMLKVVFLMYLTWRKVFFLTATRVFFSQKLFSGYLALPYSFHLQRNSADLIRNIMGDVKSWNKGLLSIMDLITDGLILIGVFVLLLWVEPVGAMSITLFLVGTATILHRVTRSKAAHWGEKSRYHAGKSVQHLLQGLNGVKDLKLLGREEGFDAQYHIHNTGAAKMERRQKVLAALPRLWFELLVIVGLVGLVLNMLAQGRPPNELVPILGLFAAAAFRLMPSMVRITSALQNLHFYRYAVETLHSEFLMLKKECGNNKNTSKKGSLTSWQHLKIKELGFMYPNTQQYVLKNINITINKNESIGFIGGSGAGKSTLIDIILGLLTPTQGVVTLDGNSICEQLRDWQSNIGYVPQSIYLTDDTIRKNIAFGLADGEIDNTAVNNALKLAMLEGFVDSLDEGIDTLVGEQGVRLSGGQRQRIGIARALYHDPSILVLDEATSALDVNTEEEVMNAVNVLRGHKTIIIIAHRMTTVANCDRLYRLKDGTIVQKGTYKEVVSN